MIPWSRGAARIPAACALAATLLAAAPLGAQEPADTTRSHVVRPGDTLWDLARRYLNDPFRWPDIFRLNRERVADPDLILPEWLLRIPGPLGVAAAVDTPPAFRPAPGRTVFFEADRPAAEGARLEFGRAAEVPLVTAGDFHRAGILVAEEEVSPVGRLAELVNPSVVPFEIPPQIGPYSRVFLTLAAEGAVRTGDRLHLLRPGRRIEGLGRIFESTGSARVLSIEGRVATVEVDELYDAVRVGDLAVPFPAFEPVMGSPDPAEEPLEGRIVAFAKPHSVQSIHDLAFVDLGEASGVEEGDELVAVLPPEPTEWGVRPEIVVARLRVVRVERRTASVKVIELEHPALQPGLPVRLVAQVP